MPSHCIGNETHTSYGVCKLYPPWSCLLCDLLSHYSLLSGHCSQTCVIKHNPSPCRCILFPLLVPYPSHLSANRTSSNKHFLTMLEQIFPLSSVTTFPLKKSTYLVYWFYSLIICSISLFNTFSSLNTQTQSLKLRETLNLLFTEPLRIKNNV